MCIEKIIADINAFRNQTVWLELNSPYYPEMLLVKTGGEVILSTIIRKESEGKWYRWHLVKRCVEGIDESSDLVKRIMAEAYNIIIFGKVNLNIIDSERHPVFKLDTNQISEAERLFPKP